MTARDNRGRYTRTPATFAERAAPLVFDELQADIARITPVARNYQERAILLTAIFDLAFLRIEALEAVS